MARATNQETVQRTVSDDEFTDITEGMPLERVLFENIPDEYVEKKDIQVFFVIVDDSQINPRKDKIGLKQIGFTKARDCLVFAPVELADGTSFGTSRQGTATFLASTLPSQYDEFYQFCYVLEDGKILGSSLPFQLNLSIETETTTKDASSNEKKILSVNENTRDGILHIDTLDTLTIDKLKQENRQLMELKRQLEIYNQELNGRISIEKNENSEIHSTLKNEIQALILEKSRTAEELANLQQSESRLVQQYEECQSLAEQYKRDSLANAERCAELEVTQAELVKDLNQVRAQWIATSQLAKDQATQIINLQNRLSRFEESESNAEQRQAMLEQQLRDFELTAEKNRRSFEGKCDSQARQLTEAKENLEQLELANQTLKENILALHEEKIRFESLFERERAQSDDLRGQIENLNETRTAERAAYEEKIAELQGQLEQEAKKTRNDIVAEKESAQALKITLTQLKERCLKHQKNEVDLRKQLTAYKNLSESLKRENEEMNARLNDGADKYKELYNKFVELQKSKVAEVAVREQAAPTRPIYPQVPPVPAFRAPQPTNNQDELMNRFLDEAPVARPPPDDGEVKSCPMCGLTFANHLKVQDKQQHIEGHFTTH